MPSPKRKNTNHNGKVSQMTFCRWLISMGYLQKLIAFTLAVIIIMPLVAHYYLGVAEMSNGEQFEGNARLTDLMGMKPAELRSHIEEMYNIRQSVQKELRELDERRQKAQDELQTFNDLLVRAKTELKNARTELDKVLTQIEQSRKEQAEIVERTLRHISAPLQILPQLDNDQPLSAPSMPGSCRQYNCFDYSRCSVVAPFRAFLYDSEAVMAVHPNTIDARNSIVGALKRTSYMTSDPSRACLFIALLWDSTEDDFDEDELEGRLHGLEYWQGDGRNHILVSVSGDKFAKSIVANVNTGRAMLAQSFYMIQKLRTGFDIVLPPMISVLRTSWRGKKFGPSYTPARRKYILSFQGAKDDSVKTNKNNGIDGDHIVSRRLSWSNNANNRGLDIESTILAEFDKIKTYSEDDIHLDFQCSDVDCSTGEVDWCLCGDEEQRANILGQSTFALILASDRQVASSTPLLTRLSEALRSGAIPVVLGEHAVLPFSQFIHWNRAVVVLPMGRVTELYYLLKTFQDSDLLSFRRQGAVLYETYFSGPESIFSGVLAAIRTRISVPANPIMEAQSKDLFPPGASRRTEKVTKITPESDDIFPPPEPPFASPTYLRNFTVTYSDHHVMWNNPPGPFFLYPNNPLDPVMPTDAQFGGSSLGFRPVGKGIGGSGKEYMESLGGNIPREQFTIVILTYQREAVLVGAVEKFLGLPFLNKVIIVWNSPQPPSEDLVWPEIHVPVKVLNGGKNSLNNRFLPFDEIETDAVLSIDDDAHLRHDEMLFGFRVWRENRDRIVGFPARYHAWDINNNNGFLYNANYTCELSMVLTGAAFIHKYYLYQYSYYMPQEIRDKVDEFMNCEDIAMNFLVSHISRKPPVKVTSRWTFRCPGCPESLSTDESHFRERHICIQYFTKVFGYTPLLYTQYRVDSVLFKTRLPKDRPKCFKFV